MRYFRKQMGMGILIKNNITLSGIEWWFAIIKAYLNKDNIC